MKNLAYKMHVQFIILVQNSNYTPIHSCVDIKKINQDALWTKTVNSCRKRSSANTQNVSISLGQELFTIKSKSSSMTRIYVKCQMSMLTQKIVITKEGLNHDSSN